jgi:mono/diheme cytochrome c family protein
MKARAPRLAAIGAVALFGLFTPPRAARGSTQDTASVWSGVYTAAQAERGTAVYANHCSRCHGDDLGANRPYPLAGEGFIAVDAPAAAMMLLSTAAV